MARGSVVKNMFIRPTEEELKSYGEPDFVVMNGSKTINKKWKEHGFNSEVYTVFNLTEKTQVIGGTWYSGEMKKGMFAMMNYYLPLQGISSMHCSANKGKDGDVAIFFGLSSTGKTRLSTDPNRELIGDDEHGWNGSGKRISIKDTRGIIDAILSDSIEKAETKTIPIF